ncbi:MAG: hypothetical protein PHO65_00385 [Sulfurovum sp.]|nr:hypothetical protein [Sulfurovum sp.]
MPTREPQEIVAAYYQALYAGDLAEVKKCMKRESYFMTLESFGLRLALRDPHFRSRLKEIENPETLKEVELKLSAELASRRKNPRIEIDSVDSNGVERKTVRFKEDGREKVLYFSKEDEGWKINYYAGRKVSDTE